jgi:fructan beta-fructosidase
MVIFYTSTGRGECIAYSNDGGKTFTEYSGNPVVEHEGRDPRVFWYKPQKNG